MHLFRQTSREKFFLSGTLVRFVGPPQPGASERGPQKPDAKETPEEKLKKEQERIAAEARNKGKELQREVVDKSGPADQYIETFKKSPRFDTLVANIQLEMESSGPPNLWNFEKWPTTEPKEALACFMDSDLFPEGKGQDAFLEGLRQPVPLPVDQSPDAKKFTESQRVLSEMVKALRDRFELQRTAQVDVQARIDAHPLGDTVGKALKTFSKNFSRSSGLEKLMMIGAVGIGAWLLKKIAGVKLSKSGDTTVGSILLGLGAAYGINYLTGKVSQDGKTVMQRLDIMRDIDDLSDDNILKGYAEKNGLSDDQEELRTFIRLQRVDVKRLFAAYQDAGGPASAKREIEPRSVGLEREGVDSKSIFSIIEQLVKETSVNEHLRVRQETARKQGIPYERPTFQDIEAWESPGISMGAFENKYVNGELGRTPQTLLTAIINEYHTEDYRAAIRIGKAGRTPDQLWKGTKDVAGFAFEQTKTYGVAAGKWMWRAGGKAYEFTRDSIAVPLGGWAVSKYRKYMPKLQEKIEGMTGWKEHLASAQEDDLNKVLPKDFAVDVTEPGRATIRGYPGLLVGVGTRKDGKEVASIKFPDGSTMEFVLDDGIAGNKLKAQELASKIQVLTKNCCIAALLQNKAGTAIDTKGLEWDSAKKQWLIKDVDVGGNSLLGIAPGKTTMHFTIDTDGKTVHFFMDQHEVSDFSDLNNEYVEGIIQEKVWSADSKAEKYLRGLSVHIVKIAADAKHGAIIEGTVGGLSFQSVLKGKTIADGLNFFDGTNTGGAELLKIEEKNGGEYFLNALAAKTLGTADYQSPFLKLEAVIDNTNDGVWARVKEMFRTTRLWVIPTNVSGLVNGQILQRQWKFTLDFKKMETLEFLKEELKKPGKSVLDIEAAYNKEVTWSLNHLEQLARDIESASEEEQAKKFQEFLSGPGEAGKQAPGLEYVNYTNSDYRKLFEEYQRMVTSYHYNYPGLESMQDAPKVADEAFEIYQVLISVWSDSTRSFAVADPSAPHPQDEISTDNQRAIRNGVTEKVRGALEVALKAGNGTVYLKNLLPELEKARLSAESGWAGSSAIATQKDKEKRGLSPKRETREARDAAGPINPTKENLDAIRAELKETFEREFPRRYAATISGEFMEKYDHILRDLPEGFLMKAITENGSEKELLSRFENEVHGLHFKAEQGRPVKEVWDGIVALCNWVTATPTWDLDGENPHIQKNMIKPRHKAGIAAGFDKLQNYYQERLIATHGHWYGDAYAKPKLDFLKDVEIPFYREYFMNKAILENQTTQQMTADYCEFLKRAMRECIKDKAKEIEQENEDKNEVVSRISDPNWTSAALFIDKAVTT